MRKIKSLGFLGFVFLALFLFISLPTAQSAEETLPAAGSAVTVTPDDCPYTVTFKLAAVALHREDNKNESWGLIGAQDLDLGWAPGMDTSIMVQRERFGVELRYLGLNQWSESKSDSFSSDVAVFEIDQSAKFKSRLHNAELNLHWWPCICCGNDRFNLLMGFRWLRLTDTLSMAQSMTGQDVPQVGGGTISCRNQFWGGQIGAEGLLFGQRDQGFSIDGVVKVGLYGNGINSHMYGYSPGGDFSGRQHRVKTSMITEFGLNANYAFTKNIAMALGYEFLYLNKVAVPVNNFGSTQSLIYNGGRLGLNFMF